VTTARTTPDRAKVPLLPSRCSSRPQCQSQSLRNATPGQTTAWEDLPRQVSYDLCQSFPGPWSLKTGHEKPGNLWQLFLASDQQDMGSTRLP
jgi:hypothetical protein